MKKFNTVEERKAFEHGAYCTKAYILFCLSNYVYSLNLGGYVQFSRDLYEFMCGKSYIPNTAHCMTFEDFCEKFCDKKKE